VSARKRTRTVSEEVVYSRPTQDFVEEPATGTDSRHARKRIKTTTDRPTLDPLDLPARVLLRHVFFLNAENSRNVSVGFYPARYYRVLTEFGGPRISLITLTEQHLTTLMEHLLKLCEAMCRGERYACKDGVFGLMYSGGTKCC
jgi:hypothetical protein